MYLKLRMNANQLLMIRIVEGGLKLGWS